MNSLAVVLLNYNGIDLLKQFLPKVLEYSHEATVAVIDNKSTDDSVVWLKKNHPKVSCVELEQNYGYAGGYNRGLKEIEADIYCLLNTDVMVTLNWIPPLLDHFNSNPATAILQPRILDYKVPNQFEYAVEYIPEPGAHLFNELTCFISLLLFLLLVLDLLLLL